MLKIIGVVAILSIGFALSAQSDVPVSAKKAKAIEKQERLSEKHKTWDSCFVVKSNGDTIYGKVDHRADQSTLMSRYISDIIIFFAHTNEKEEQFIPNNLKELYVFNLPEGFRKYLVLQHEYYSAPYGILYRIAVDGPCKLIADRAKDNIFIQDQTAGIVDPNRMAYEEGDLGGSTEIHYYLYYKKKITPIKVVFSKDDSGSLHTGISAGFRTKCRKVFSECPALVEQIENKTFRSDDLIEIVKEFNTCIETKN
ncbi:MAG: hypothetical protein V4615_02125 [Bacteroidota bacterium]